MPRTCTICAHAEHQAINGALLANEPYRNVSVRFGTSVAALQRHKAEHLPDALSKAREIQETQEIALADDLYEQVKQLRDNAVRILTTAEGAGDLRTALLGIREARSCIELLLEVEGRLARTPTVNIHLSPEWLEVRAVVIQALQPYPEARTAVAGALMQVSSGDR